MDKKIIIWLSEQQKQLDQFIMDKHQLTSTNEILKKKIIAFLVELGEYANEERSFKYWSTKAESNLPIQLDEYIDGLHFIISIGNQIGFDFKEFEQTTYGFTSNIEAYLGIVVVLAEFIVEFDLEIYEDLLSAYLEIGEIKHYSTEQIVEAYKIKNKVNFERQNNNY